MPASRTRPKTRLSGKGISPGGGLHAARNRGRAEAAEADSRERLQTAYTEQARAIRASGEAGSRAATIDLISNAVAIPPSLDLRTEAVACLALSDLVQEGPLIPTPKDLPRVEMDAQLRNFAYGTTNGTVLVHSLADGRELYCLTAANLGSQTRRTVGELSFSPDGRWLAARFSSGAAVVWNMAMRKTFFASGVAETNTKPALPLTCLMFSADSRRLIFSDRETQGRISVADLAVGRTVPSPVAVAGKMFRLRPDLQQVAVVTDTSVDIWEYPSGFAKQTLRHPAQVELMEWSPECRSGSSRRFHAQKAGGLDLVYAWYDWALKQAEAPANACHPMARETSKNSP